MHEYYFKIRKDDIEFEFSTTDKTAFEQQLADWINGLVNGAHVKEPQSSEIFQSKEAEQSAPRSGFKEIKALASINSMTAPSFDFSDTKEERVAEVNFERALEESMQHPKTEVVEKQDTGTDFLEFYNRYNPQNDIDKLVVAGLYILNIEHEERFTIKQINAKLVPSTGSAIDHSTVDEAIKQNLLRIVPDLTETNEYTEYTLTDEGENYFIV